MSHHRTTPLLPLLLLVAAAIITCARTAPAPAPAEPPADVTVEAAPPPYDIMEEPCRVGSLQYKHGEKVPRQDPCELCLCLHSGLFCWWQDQPGCPQRSTASATPGGSAVSHSAASPAVSPAAAAAATITPALDTPLACVHTESCESGTAATSGPPTTAGAPASESPQGPTSAPPTADSSPPPPGVTSPAASSSSSSTAPPVTRPTCSVMGTQYEVGQVLPRATGTCLECVCGEGARLSCSPKDCGGTGPSGRGEGPSGVGTGPGDLDLGPSLDMFDVDTF